VSEINDGLPRWANFLVGGFECPDIDLTLGRDGIMNNIIWEAAKTIVADKLSSEIVSALADKRSNTLKRWDKIFSVHREDIVKSATADVTNEEGKFYNAVKDIIPFNFGNELITIRDAISRNICLDKDGRDTVFFHATGFRRHESAGVQEALLFDEIGLRFIDARNYFDRDFLRVYGSKETNISLVPVEDGLEYIIDYSVDDELNSLISTLYLDIRVNARLCKFNPDTLSAVIIPVDVNTSRRTRPNDADLASYLAEVLSGRTDVSTAYRPYSLCVNESNRLVKELIRYCRDYGVDSYVRSMLHQIYYMSVLVFGDTDRSVIAEMTPGLAGLMLQFLKRSADLDHELQRVRDLLDQETDKSDKIEAILKLSSPANKENSVFVAYGYDKETTELVDQFKRMMSDNGVNVSDGKILKSGSLSKHIIERIRSSSMFIGVLTTRDIMEREASGIPSTWVIEEKGVAAAFGIPILLIIEESISKRYYGNIEGDSIRIEVADNKPVSWINGFNDALSIVKNTLEPLK